MIDELAQVLTAPMSTSAAWRIAEGAIADAEDGRPDGLFIDLTLRAVETIERGEPNATRPLYARLSRGLAAELRRALRDRARRQEEPSPEADDWPGRGDVASFLQTEPPPICWFATERLLADRAHLLTGIGGSSKTRVLYHLALGAVVGRVPWGWQIERTGSAALVLAEDTAAGVHRTLAAMARSMRLSATELDLLSHRLHAYPLAGKQSRLLMSTSDGSLVESHRVDRLLEALRQLPAPLVFVGLDPALAMTEGNEMDAAHQRRIGELADRIAIQLDACVVLVSHAAKALQAIDEIGSHTSRGSGAITDAVRGEFALRTMTAPEAKRYGIAEIEERKAHVQLVCVKGNELPPSAFVPQWLRRVAGGALEPATLTEQDDPAIGRREFEAIDLLRRLSATAVPQLRDWRHACEEAGLITGATDEARSKAMQRIKSSLLRSGLIEPGVGRNVFVPTADAADILKP